MKNSLRVLCCALLALLILDPITAKRNYGGGRHSYPKSGGLSGGGSHSYPHSGGLSGGSHSSSGGHSYPSSGGLSGGSHSSSGGHSYPNSGGISGGSHSSSGHGYPSSGGGLSGNSHGHTGSNTGYPSGKGLSGNTHTVHTTNVHHHYHYNPPQQIRYAPVHGGPPVSYPVYHGTPPNYVYQYKDSGSKYGTLLAGLALLNLGTVAAGAYALSHSHSNYKPQPGEVCRFGVKKDNGDYEETKIDCALITSFIFQEQAKTQQNSATNTTTTTTTVTNVTMVNMTNTANEEATNTNTTNSVFQMLPNGTLVPINVTVVNGTMNAANVTNEAPPAPSAGNTMTSVVTVTNTTTVTNALDVKGKPIEVTPGMQCYVIRQTPTSKMNKNVPCGLLQTYAEKSLKKNSASRNIPALTILTGFFTLYIVL